MPDNEEIEGVKFSEFPSATPDNADEVVGLHSGDNARFSVANFILAVRQGLANLFVPLTRTINNKALSSDITLDASDVGAVDTDDVGVADGVASLDSTGKVPSTQLPPIASTAADVAYDNTQSGLTATDVQEAIDELAQGGGGGGGTAASVTYDNTASGLTATNVQDAIDEAVDDLDAKFDVDQVADPEGATASRNYTVGEVFTRDGNLHVVTVSTAVGNALVDGTNCKVIKLSEGFIGAYAQPISNTNLNTMLVSGMFISVTGNSNTPTSTYTSEYTPFMVIGNGSIAAQIFVLRDGTIRSRMCISGSWTAWQS